MSRLGVLAEGEELSSNPLRRVFKDLRTTPILVDVDWRILKLLQAHARIAWPLFEPELGTGTATTSIVVRGALAAGGLMNRRYSPDHASSLVRPLLSN
jgi:hypothetical protein